MRISSIWRRFSGFLVLSLLVAGTTIAQDMSAMWNAAKRVKLGLDRAATSQPIQIGGEATMNPLSPPNTPDVQVFNPSVFWQSENSIGVNFSNGNQLMVSTNGQIPGANPVVQQPWAFSTDGGVTWPASLQSESIPPGILDCFGDPVAYFDRSGRAYYSTLGSPGGIYFVSTTNFGATWSARSNGDNLNSGNDDKQHAAADYSGTFPNNIYTAWTDFGVSGTPIQFARSTNQGTSWLPRVALPIGANRGQGVHIAIGPNGEVYVIWAHYTTGTAEVGIGMAKSTDGGATFNTPAIAFPINGSRISNGAIGALNGTRGSSFPYADVDRSSGSRRGWVYTVTAELDVATTGQSDIYVRRSTDGGGTWSSAMRVNGPDVAVGRWQFMPSIAVDPTSGGITVSYYSFDSTGNTTMANRYAAYSVDGGSTWDNFVVSDVRALWAPQLTPNTNTVYNGDYYETAAMNGRAWPCWTDRRLGAAGTNNRAYVQVIQYAENFGWARGLVTTPLAVTTPVQGVLVDFVQPLFQQPGTSQANGAYLAGAKVDTPGLTANYTIRARKFGYLDFTDTITIVRNDTVTRNISITPAPGGTLSVYSHTPTINLRSYVEVKFGSLTVISDSTNATTGLLTAPLPTGTYSVRVDAPPPYATKTFPAVVINASATTNVDALTRAVVEFNPTAMRDTLVVGQLHAKTLTLTNTTSDTVPYRISDDNALARVWLSKPAVQPPAHPMPAIERPKGVPQSAGPAQINGRGGPDAFGYSWIDSDEPGGPTFSWVDITAVGTQITGIGDDTNVGPFPIGFNFNFYGNTYSTIRFCTNGFLSFTSTSTSFSPVPIPNPAEPNNGIYPFWEDFNFALGGTAHYYYDAANGRFIVQYTNVPHFSSGGPYTLEVILYPNGEILYQYLNMNAPLNLATIGIENAAGTVALQVAAGTQYVHNNLAVRFYLPNATWLSENPLAGTLQANTSQDITVSFDATGLLVGTTYNANIFVDATHPDVSGRLTVPASLKVNPADSAVLILSRATMTFPTTPVNVTRRDSLTARNGGLLLLTISSLSTTNGDFVVTPTSAMLAPGDSVHVYVDYTPSAAGSDTGRVIILSNSQGTPRSDVILTGTGIAVPHFAARLDSLIKTVEGGVRDSILFYVRNTGTGVGNFAARAVMFPRTGVNGALDAPIVIPMTVERAITTGTVWPQSLGSVPEDADIFQGLNNATSVHPHPADDPSNVQFWSAGPAGVMQQVPERLYYRFNESGGTATQNFANPGVGTNPAPLLGTLTMGGTGQFGAALIGVGGASSTNYVNTGWNTALGNGSWTISMWLNNLPSNTTLYYLMGDVTATSFRSFLGGAAGAGNVTLRATGLTDAIVTGVAPGPTVVTYVYDASVNQVRGYKNGVLAVTAAATLNLNGTAPFKVGGYSTLTGLPPGGLMDQFRMYNRALSASEVLATWNVDIGAGAEWLAISPTAGTIAITDSTLMVARFDATDPSIYNNPGNYYGRVEITATNSTLADSLNLPVRMFVQPPAGPRLAVNPDTLGFGNVEIGSNRILSTRVQNIGGATLNVTGITMSDLNYSANQTNFSLASLETLRVNVTFTAPSPGAVHNGTMSFTSNDPGAPQVRLTARSLGVAHIALRPNAFLFEVAATNDTTRQTMQVANTGTDTLRYDLREAAATLTRVPPVQPPALPMPAIERPKGVPQPVGPTLINGRGGPDAFGYIWIDSDEPGGPTFSWVDITAVGTQITGIGDDTNVGPFPIGFSFNFYGNTYSTIRFCTNGFLSFTSTSTSFTPVPIPNPAEPNNGIYPFWEDFNFALGGTAHYYYDVANGRFIVQYTNVPHFSSGGPYTLEVILYPSGNMVYQYLNMNAPLNLATIGIENAAGTVALQVAAGTQYVHNNLAVLITTDLFPWLSTSRTSGTIAPGDSQAVQVRVHPGLGFPPGNYPARLVATGNTPDVVSATVNMDVQIPDTTFVNVTSPNGGEQWAVGLTYPITWVANQVDTVKIEYSTTGSGGPWNLITAGTPGLSAPFIHPKLRVKNISGGTDPTNVGNYMWTIPNAITNNAYVRVTDRDSLLISDVSDAAFSIVAVPPQPPTWRQQASGTGAILYSVSMAMDTSIAWAAGAGGVVFRTTNGGNTWLPAASVGIDAYNIFAMDDSTAFVASDAASNARILRTTNAGTSWQQVYQSTDPAAFIDAIHMFDTSNGYALGDPVGGLWVLLRTSNGGTTWVLDNTLIAGAEAGWNNSMWWIGNQYGWFGTNNTRVYYTTNGGTNWSPGVTTGMVNSYSVAFADALLGMSGGSAGGQTMKSTDGGTTFTASAASGSAALLGMTAVDLSPARWYDVGSGGVYKTTNQGTSWSLDHSRAGLNHIAMKYITGYQGADYLCGYAVGNGGAISKYMESLVPVGVIAGPTTPTQFMLDQNYPNPFNPTTEIRYALPYEAAVTLKIFNILGQEIATLVNETQSAAYYQVTWDGTNSRSGAVASGIYFFRMDAAPSNGGQHFTQIRKMLMLK